MRLPWATTTSTPCAPTCSRAATSSATAWPTSASRSRPQGTYFVTTDIRPLGHTDGITFCRQLPERTGVVAIPHQVFYDNQAFGRPLVRWAFCKQPTILQEALTRLQKL